ncbi:unnamed protein product, partial [Amoebophrya sp. A25]|eukprot:GSA25T00004200001.1
MPPGPRKNKPPPPPGFSGPVKKSDGASEAKARGRIVVGSALSSGFVPPHRRGKSATSTAKPSSGSAAASSTNKNKGVTTSSSKDAKTSNVKNPDVADGEHETKIGAKFVLPGKPAVLSRSANSSWWRGGAFVRRNTTNGEGAAPEVSIEELVGEFEGGEDDIPVTTRDAKSGHQFSVKENDTLPENYQWVVFDKSFDVDAFASLCGVVAAPLAEPKKARDSGGSLAVSGTSGRMRLSQEDVDPFDPSQDLDAALSLEQHGTPEVSLDNDNQGLMKRTSSASSRGSVSCADNNVLMSPTESPIVRRHLASLFSPERVRVNVLDRLSLRVDHQGGPHPDVQPLIYLLGCLLQWPVQPHEQAQLCVIAGESLAMVLEWLLDLPSRTGRSLPATKLSIIAYAREAVFKAFFSLPAFEDSMGTKDDQGSSGGEKGVLLLADIFAASKNPTGASNKSYSALKKAGASSSCSYFSGISAQQSSAYLLGSNRSSSFQRKIFEVLSALWQAILRGEERAWDPRNLVAKIVSCIGKVAENDGSALKTSMQERCMAVFVRTLDTWHSIVVSHTDEVGAEQAPDEIQDAEAAAGGHEESMLSARDHGSGLHTPASGVFEASTSVAASSRDTRTTAMCDSSFLSSSLAEGLGKRGSRKAKKKSRVIELLLKEAAEQAAFSRAMAWMGAQANQDEGADAERQQQAAQLAQLGQSKEAMAPVRTLGAGFFPAFEK